ncbi:hypothetical protein [Paenibacillus xylaniclasticus]|uniref:hypothetical protein n=1 Tax=Paenibacillus xylaniclasticus TaxID=588083 RepID=UPI000FDB2451|nr:MULTISPECIES: hypothetical protein [Paenibacillus]GFN32405.1 hypothetical protein PCURB6_26650 [Paenibacillus curdlanolyticus]
MIEQLSHIHGLNKIVENMKYQLNNQWHGKKLDIGELVFEDNSYDFTFHSIEIDGMLIRIDYWIDDNGKSVRCYDYIQVEQFLKYVKLINE